RPLGSAVHRFVGGRCTVARDRARIPTHPSCPHPARPTAVGGTEPGLRGRDRDRLTIAPPGRSATCPERKGRDDETLLIYSVTKETGIIAIQKIVNHAFARRTNTLARCPEHLHHLGHPPLAPHSIADRDSVPGPGVSKPDEGVNRRGRAPRRGPRRRPPADASR